uniref:Uncharacterized protein n=1 Tax=Rhizophagus irregularis (strain DAOM 181602 / DAOM 197198 / MUCL 43194) TaxID=747089 RepID=U9UDA5_RHIID
MKKFKINSKKSLIHAVKNETDVDVDLTVRPRFIPPRPLRIHLVVCEADVDEVDKEVVREPYSKKIILFASDYVG